MPRVLLDLSRLVSSSRRPAPSGIDRVELAYAQHYLRSKRCLPCALNARGRMAMLEPAVARNFVDTLAARWQGDRAAARRMPLLWYFTESRLWLTGERSTPRANGPGVHLLVSHHHLDRPQPIERFLQRTGSRFACVIHDLIPHTHPEYARPGQPEIHAARMRTAARLADGLIFNSQATASQFDACFPREREALRLVAPLGLDLPRAMPTPAATPYFICISTIEPRKNHLLLLNLWRALAADRGTAPPKLVIVGRRGWENQNIIDLIERSRAVDDRVEERNFATDAEVATLLAGARALLLPSFAEGYGLPAAEALAAGVPVICSDLPALREVGGEVPEYLDPRDNAAWRRAILDYADAGSTRRLAQLERLRRWTAPAWPAHFAAVDKFLQRLCANVSQITAERSAGSP